MLSATKLESFPTLILDFRQIEMIDARGVVRTHLHAFGARQEWLHQTGDVNERVGIVLALPISLACFQLYDSEMVQHTLNNLLTTRGACRRQSDDCSRQV